MDGFSPLFLAATLMASAAVSLLVLWALGRSWASNTPDSRGKASGSGHRATFVFQDDILVDQDTPAETMPGVASGDIGTWSSLRSWLGCRFGPLPRSLDDLDDGELRDLPATDVDDMATLSLSRLNDGGRVQVTDPARAGPLDRHSTRRLGATITRYQTVFDKAPCAVRILDPAGRMLWQNAVFASYDPAQAQHLIDTATAKDTPTRLRMPGPATAEDRVCEVVHIRAGDVRAVFATDVTQVANAEALRREFIQTLTKIFANLTTGLAVFDRHRNLALFNPALLDLTGLPAPILSSQPSLIQFFDSLRDNRVLPEPKNYASWRNQIETMISSAAGGLYLEDWNLPNGMTYRVTGRPHPDGAIAFLFEDITDNVSLARHFRSQISLCEAVLDASDEAKIVFGPDNIVSLCNRPCRQLLDIDPDASFADMTLREVVTVCGEFLPRDGVWGRVEQAVLNRAALEETLPQPGGSTLICRVGHLPGNSAIITLLAQHGTSRSHAKAQA
ncbi:PAS-domain containing protein [Roseovarius sp.]|uniref:PAS-domain containing protein n=1 Tax=Roseovarius sp. TaxID=1486281 RepID=UPI003D0E612A